VKHAFSVVYDLDCTVGEAVAAYLDVEHYVFLHKGYTDHWHAIEHAKDKLRVRQTWSFAGLRTGIAITAQYIPPARFLNYDSEPWPRWIPSIHHLIRTSTDLRYFPDPTGTKTVSHLDITVEMSLLLWPLRKLIERMLTRLKIEKDAEDIEMIARRQQIYGRGNLKTYMLDHQFMLHKDSFVAHFGADARLAAEPSGSRSENPC
jgi:hypothetical protein